MLGGGWRAVLVPSAAHRTRHQPAPIELTAPHSTCSIRALDRSIDGLLMTLDTTAVPRQPLVVFIA